MKGLNIKQIMNAVKSVLSHRKVYRYEVNVTTKCMEQKPMKGCIGFITPMEYKLEKEDNTKVYLYSFKNIDSNKFESIVGKYIGIILPYPESTNEFIEKFTNDNPEFFSMDVEIKSPNCTYSKQIYY